MLLSDGDEVAVDCLEGDVVHVQEKRWVEVDADYGGGPACRYGCRLMSA
jgi:hypothetical protein